MLSRMVVDWKRFSGDKGGRWTSRMFNIEQSDTVRPDLGWYVLTYDYNYYNDMPPKIPDLELVLLSNPDMWEDSFKVYVKFRSGRLTMMCESDAPDYINDDLVDIVMREFESNKYLGSVPDTWDSVAGSKSLDQVVVRRITDNLSNNINSIQARPRLPDYLTGGTAYDYSKP